VFLPVFIGNHLRSQISLILAGDSICLLPCMRKSFQTSMQGVFDVSFTQRGVLNAMFMATLRPISGK